jgi:hypothetical protein
MEGIHARYVEPTHVVVEQALEHRRIEKVAVGLDPETGPLGVARGELFEGVEEQLGPGQDLSAREDDPAEGDVIGVR